MRRVIDLAIVSMTIATMCGCALSPGMPPDFLLPVQQIVLHSACELRLALREISISHPSFLNHQWAISISLTPKIDTETSLRAGLTGKSTSGSAPFFNTWSVGNAPGTEYDMKGHTDGAAAYALRSEDLLDKGNTLPLNCDVSSPAYNALAHHLGIRDWLERTAAAAEGDISRLTKIDKPTYNSEIIITFDGSGTFTYNFPFGTDFLGFLGSYKLDETLSIAFTPEATKGKPVRTLPTGAEYSSVSDGTTGVVSAAAQSRLDLLSLQQSIVNLQSAITQRR
jgi:hypothetical protein